MKLTTTYLYGLSSLSSTMASTINYKDTLFKRANLTPIHGKPTFETLYKLWNKIKANTNSVYSNIGGGAHGHIGLVLTEVQYALISNTPFVYLTHLVPLIIPDGTTVHAKSNTIISHTQEVHNFRGVVGFKQTLVQQVVATFKEANLTDIRNHMKNTSTAPWLTFSLTSNKMTVS